MPGWVFYTTTWCEQVSEYVKTDDPARMYVRPEGLGRLQIISPSDKEAHP